MKKYFALFMVLALVISCASLTSAKDKETTDTIDYTTAAATTITDPENRYSVQIIITYHDITTEDASVLLDHAGKVFKGAQQIEVDVRAQ